ncbi:tellurite methyltransferase [Bacillus sp. SORGH_AS 510]|uniref:class I SAM-dependent methyltransferase n=1 Tax=Bacillus sp. SORGH_AS_0510 TaxID=3041771 RepID=UPI00278BA3D5|nr:methyltransferase domain-containing protein [Bacillus sp. SORGH_AS_0510]MDQ1145716.1 tellurite methyltransferase [Bacillus sp. SORGH_AS_0510]
MNSRIKWNSKYKERLNQPIKLESNPRLKKLSDFLTGGKALDLACGIGGNSLFLAQMNYEVEAVDISDVAIQFIKEQALIYRLAINPKIYDLTELGKKHWHKWSFDLVVMTYYLDRSLFPLVKTLIKKKGYFFMETFYQSQESSNQGVSDQYKLKPKELQTVFNDWKIHFFEEDEKEGRQTIFCQKL